MKPEDAVAAAELFREQKGHKATVPELMIWLQIMDLVSFREAMEIMKMLEEGSCTKITKTSRIS